MSCPIARCSRCCSILPTGRMAARTRPLSIASRISRRVIASSRTTGSGTVPSLLALPHRLPCAADRGAVHRLTHEEGLFHLVDAADRRQALPDAPREVLQLGDV